MGGNVTLNSEQQTQLANIIYRQEVEAIQNIKFKSEPELAKYLRDSRACYESVLGLLGNAGELKAQYQNDNTKGSIASDILSYVLQATDFSLQFVNNYHLRTAHLNKIRDHYKTLADGLHVLNPVNAPDVARLADEVALYKHVMIEYMNKYQSPASLNFSQWLKEKKVKFPELVESYKRKLGYAGSFKDMEDAKKIKVYDEIMEASGRGRVVGDKLTNVFEAVGKAVVIFSAAMSVWDIFSSDHIIQQATREVVVTVAAEGGAILGDVVGAAISTLLVAAEASAVFVVAAGIITGLVGAFILGAFAGWLIDLIFSSGGSAPFSTDGHHCYVAPLPDGETLARQIAHQSN